MLKDKNIILGVCGSIASYKSAEIVRLLVKAGANVKVILTDGAKAFITPLTFSTLSKNPVYSTYANADTGVWNNHVELALWADLIVIAPATANTIAKFANGLCNNLLSAVYLSAKCPIYVAPAMDLDMWKHLSTKNNIVKLRHYGNEIISPAKGELASGLYGEGRLAEPEEIVNFINQKLSETKPLAGQKALVSAGPTYEAIDPVRFIGNHSSGKMGYAIAAKLKELGATVTLISGPTALDAPKGVNRISVTSAAEMFENCQKHFSDSQICVMAAAVADYTVEEVAPFKIKKKDSSLTIPLKKTPDILATLGAVKTAQILVGFALETDHEEANATEKLKKKNLDFIVLNSLNDAGAGFQNNTNKITIIDKTLEKTVFPLKSKDEVATDICEKIVSIFADK